MRKATLLALFVALTLVALGCGKKDKNQDKKEPAPTEVKPLEPKPEPVQPPEKKPSVELTGTPSQNLITLFQYGLDQVKANQADPAKAAAALQDLLEEFDVADLRAKSKAAKEAGQGATDEDKAKFQAAQEEYKKLATEIGGKDETFNAAHQEWSKAWGLN